MSEPDIVLVRFRARAFKGIKKRPNKTEVPPLPYSFPISHTLYIRKRNRKEAYGCYKISPKLMT